MQRICALVVSSLFVLVGCDQAERALSQQRPTYAGCLQTAVGGHNLSVADVRELCAEAAQVIDASYKFKDKTMVPSNEFTRCYDKERKALEAAGVAQAIRFAKLSCKYPDVK